jgi:hypothetical protein
VKLEPAGASFEIIAAVQLTTFKGFGNKTASLVLSSTLPGGLIMSATVYASPIEWWTLSPNTIFPSSSKVDTESFFLYLLFLPFLKINFSKKIRQL